MIYYSATFAQAPNIDWQKTFGGDNSDILYSINKTTDGGFIIGGSSTSDISGDKTVANNGNSTSDYWIIKSDMSGEIQWQKSIGGFGAESYTQIFQTYDGGYIIGGSSTSDISGDKTENSFGDYDYWIVKLDNLGNIQWDKTLGGSALEEFKNVIETPDGGVLVGGTSTSPISGNKTENPVGYVAPFLGADDYWVVKLDATGTIQWQNTIGSNENESFKDLINCPDGGYLLGGISDGSVSGDKTEASRGLNDYWIVKLDNLGEISWNRTIGGSKSDGLTTLITTNSGYLLGGNSRSPISGDKTVDVVTLDNFDFWIVKINTTGDILWQKNIGGDGFDSVIKIAKDIHGNFLLAGYSLSNISYNKTENSRGSSDFWVVKINDTGTILWDKTIGGEQSDNIYGLCYDLIDDSFILGGTSSSSDSGDKTDVSRGQNDYWIVKLASDNLKTEFFNQTSISVYPNPTKNKLNITFDKIYKKIYLSLNNLLGEEIQQENFVNANKIELDLKASDGIYFLSISNENNQKTTFKIIKE